MIDRIKNLFSDKDIEELGTKFKENLVLVKEQNEQIKKLSENINSLNSDISSFKQEHVVLQQVFDRNLDHVKQLKGDFEKEIADFKMMKNSMHDIIVDRACAALNERLSAHLDRLKTDIQAYNSLKSNMDAVNKNFEELRAEISRLKEVSGNIKAGDFELKHFAGQLAQQDKHKLELMQKIDTLQTVIAHERRKRY